MSVGGTFTALGNTFVGARGGIANSSFNVVNNTNGFGGIVAPAGEYLGWQGVQSYVYKSMQGYANSAGNGNANVSIGAESWVNGTFKPVTPANRP